MRGPPLEHLTFYHLGRMLETGHLSVIIAHRRQTLIAVADLAKDAKSHTPYSRARLKRFRETLESEQNNDEIEVTGEMLCEVVMLAMEAKSSR